MGLDLVELMMEIEDAFGVEITDDAWERLDLNRVGGIVDFLYEEFAGETVSGIQSKWTEEIDHRFLGQLGVRGSDLPPDTRVLDLFGDRNPGRTWNAMGLTPAAARSSRVLLVILFLVLGAGVLGWHYFGHILNGIIVGYAVLSLALLLTGRFIEVPDPDRRIRDLFLWHNACPDEPVSRDFIFLRVRGIVCRVLDVWPEKVGENTRLIEDLGAG